MDKQSPKILIKVNGAETAYIDKNENKTTKQDEFNWVLPEQSDPFENVVPFRGGAAQQPVPLKKQRGSGKKMAVIIGTAVLLGTGFGVTVLNVLNDTDNTPASSTVPTAAVVQEEQTAGAAASSVWSGLTVHVVQGAAFSTKEQAQAAADDFKKKGTPASVVSSANMFFVIVGVANEETSVNRMATSYSIKTIKKKRTVAETDLSERYKESAPVLAEAGALFQDLLAQASVRYANGQIDENKWKEMTGQYEFLTAEGKNLQDEQAKKFVTYVSLAYSTLEDYRTNGDADTFMKLQQFLLDGFSSYEAIASGSMGD